MTRARRRFACRLSPIALIASIGPIAPILPIVLFGLIALGASWPIGAAALPARQPPTTTGAGVAGAGVAAAPALSIIPKPTSLTTRPGRFALGSGTVIITDHDTRSVGASLAQLLAPATGFALDVRPPPSPKSNAILIERDSTLDRLGQEGYLLDITPERVIIRCFAPAGAFYAAQTLRQLLPPAIFGATRASGPWTLPALSIEDVPRFAWRGLMLDSARHFIPKTELLKFVDLLAAHKMNTLHWHLTDDQGWRIEIKKYPRLTAIGAKRKETRVGRADAPPGFDGVPHGGFYTQGDVRELVAYARARYVTLVPEIAMPGHTQAAIAAYPELGNQPAEKLDVATSWGVSPHIVNPSAATIDFLQAVMGEVVTLFPGRFVHVGGEAVPIDEWKASAAAQARVKELGLPGEAALRGYIIGQMNGFLERRGRRLVGWDGMLDADGNDVAPGATIIVRHGGGDRAVAAVRTGHDIVMAPGDVLGFDRGQPVDAPAAAGTQVAAGAAGAQQTRPPLSAAGLAALQHVYAFEPVPAALTPGEASRVLGAEGLLWTEDIATPAQLESMAFPRAVALAEVTWSAKDARDFADFRARLGTHEARLAKRGVSFTPVAK